MLPHIQNPKNNDKANQRVSHLSKNDRGGGVAESAHELNIERLKQDCYRVSWIGKHFAVLCRYEMVLPCNNYTVGVLFSCAEQQF